VAGGLEEVLNDPDAFATLCPHFPVLFPESGAGHRRQWSLEAAAPLALPHPCWWDSFQGSLAPEWTWVDPLDGGSFTVGTGLEIHAPNGRDLWGINWSAPRLLHPLSGAFAVQTICVPATGEKPVIGGLLLWKDRQSYLYLTRGSEGEHQLRFGGSIENEDQLFGRGRLPSARLFLRLEQVGGHVRALCSADGEEWFTVGAAEFAAEDPVQVGLCAIGAIDRTIYPGTFPEGTAIRFESFALWRCPPH
jgi:hypothetical protein